MKFLNWYLGLYSSPDDKVILAAWTATLATITFLLNFIFKKIFNSNLIWEFVKYCFSSIFKYWFESLLLIGIIILINLFTNFQFLGNFISIKFVGITIVMLVLFTKLIPIILERWRRDKPLNISVYGCFTVKENKRLTIDIVSEEFNQKIESIIEEVSTNVYAYSKNTIEIKQVELPGFLIWLWGLTKLNNNIKKRVFSKKHLASLHFIKNINQKSITALINFDKETLINTEPTENAQKLINALFSNPEIREISAIEVSVKIYLLLYSQIHLDFLADSKQLVELHYTLDGCEKLLLSIKEAISSFPNTGKESVNSFLNIWESNFQRYRAIALIEQKEYIGATKAIFKAIQLNPFFPYESYDILKPNFTKKYGVEIVPTLNQMQMEVGEIGDSYHEENIRIGIELSKQIKYFTTTFNYEIVHEIIRRDSSDGVINLITSEIEKLDNNIPFLLLTKSEILKYLKKGTEKINQIYLERFDECIALLRTLINLDPDFVVVRGKLGSLLLLKGVHYQNQDMISQGTKEFVASMHFMSQLGFKVK